MLGDNIRRLRLDQHLSQTDFGKLFYVSQGAVSQWEQGTTRPSTSQLLAIANAFDVPLEQLVQDEPLPSFREFSYLASPDPLSPAEEQLVLDFRSLNQKGKERIRMLMDDYLLIYREET